MPENEVQFRCNCPLGLDKQVDRLARFIMDNVPGEPSRSEGAIDTAIRLLKQSLAEPFPEKMMPGQEPYTFEERLIRGALISAAAAGDPGEQGEQGMAPGEDHS